ncbi:carbohydrate ABC transporter permease [Cohnella sp. JJ-181]|uniref:carbohydrate ABC transporter permease n=1 Tax=Cohnella rhizoplanae TaxID=2974897 RepID=UPI0022FF5CA4|nr:carbohydrate ABC transporter permease [Cohnella sp. JJ-181]CAI6083364.1 Diacetylchitobiose uptake system permease protein DasC [Cohnella sp. JJ-181]
MVASRGEKRFWMLLTYAVLILFSVYCLFPFLWMLVTSLKPTEQIRSVNPTFWIDHPTFKHFANVLYHSKFGTYFANSVKVALSTTVIAIAVSIFAGYALSRYGQFRGVKSVGVAMLLSQMIPGVLLMIPLYLIMKHLGLINTPGSLIIAYTTFMIPLCTFMMKSFFDSVPMEIEESAEMDGCGKLGTIFRIVLPVSIPSLIATSLFAFVNAWNEFMFGYVFINADENRTLTPGIMLFKGLYLTDWGSISAASVLSVLPVIIMFAYMQRFLVEGMTAGAVKG